MVSPTTKILGSVLALGLAASLTLYSLALSFSESVRSERGTFAHFVTITEPVIRSFPVYGAANELEYHFGCGDGPKLPDQAISYRSRLPVEELSRPHAAAYRILTAATPSDSAFSLVSLTGTAARPSTLTSQPPPPTPLMFTPRFGSTLRRITRPDKLPHHHDFLHFFRSQESSESHALDSRFPPPGMRVHFGSLIISEMRSRKESHLVCPRAKSKPPSTTFSKNTTSKDTFEATINIPTRSAYPSTMKRSEAPLPTAF